MATKNGKSTCSLAVFMVNKEMTIRSALEKSGLHWPAIPSVRGAQLLALLYQMEQSEKWSAQQVLSAQQVQLESLLAHAREATAFYAKHFNGVDSTIRLKSDAWHSVPLLTRGDVLRNAVALHSTKLPRAHGRTHTTQSSGSTGQPVVVRRTEVTRLLWQAIALREHLWQKRDATLPSAIIRATGPNLPQPNGLKVAGWGSPFDLIWNCGPSYLLSINTDVKDQAQWLLDHRPAYLLTHPSNLEALLEQPEMEQLALQQILCIGETVTDQLRKRTADLLHTELIGNYSSQELGYLALHCPECGQYHVQSESVYLEVLDADGMPCAQGQVGRVVVTDLHNFAMPLIRYEVGDYAEVGKTCTVRPGLMTLSHILGRRRNMVVHPDGRRHWPVVGFEQFNAVAPIRQFQFVQRTRDDIEVRLVIDSEMTSAQLGGMTKIIHQALGHPFNLNFRQWAGALPKTKGGKFEEFICLAN